MADRISEYVISLGIDPAAFEADMSKIGITFNRGAAELQRTAGKLDLFGAISDNLPKVQAAIDSAKTKISQLTAEIAKIEATGGKAPKELVKALGDAEKAAASATKEFNAQNTKLNELQAALSKAGVNTKSLASEQERLATATKAASDAAAVQAAKQQLGLTTLKDTEGQAAKLRQAFDTLKNSGSLSANEIAAAQKRLQQELKELAGTVTTTGSAFKANADDAKSFFSALGAGAAAAGVSFGALISIYKDAVAASREYQQSIAQLGAVTNLSGEQLAGVGKEVRALAVDLGLELPAAFKGLTDLLRSGVPRDNVIDVLRTAAEAAKAATVDLGEGVKAADVLLSGFGVTIEELPRALDKVIAGAKSGGVTLTEFGNALGPLSNIARDAAVPLEEIVATLGVMVSAGIDAGSAATALGQIIQKLGSAEVRGKLADLGITSKSLVDTFVELGRRGRGLEEVLALGIGNPKNAAAVAALTNNIRDLKDKFDAATSSAEATQKVLDGLKGTPLEVTKQFNAALKETNITLGETVGSGSGYAAILTKLLNGFNALNPEIRTQLIVTGELNKLFGLTIGSAIALAGSVDKVTTSVTNLQTPAQNVGAEIEAINKKLAAQRQLVESSLAIVTERTAALQKAGSEQIAAITERVDAEIAQLDRSAEANVATTQRIVGLQKDAAVEKIAVAKATEDEILRVTREAIEARSALIREQGGANAEEKVNQARVQFTLAGNQQILAQYRAFYGDLKTQAQGFQQSLTQIEGARTALAESTEQKVRAARMGGLTDLQQYAEKQQEVDRLITKGRETASTEGIAAARKYFDQADAISETIKGEVLSDGVVVVSALQSQQTQIGLLKKSADAYGNALSEAKDKAQAGADATKAALDTVSDKIKQLAEDNKALQKTFSEGVTIKINDEIVGLQKAEAEISNLTRERTVLLRVQRTEGNGAGAPSGGSGGGATGEFHAGGLVWKQQLAQLYAGGGPVFRRPAWTKVPGVGNADTVPAALPVGAFVIRKAAAQFYGDSGMARLARGYASGGPVEEATQAELAIAYHNYIVPFLRLYPIFREAIAFMAERVKLIIRNPGDSGSVEALIKDVGSLASNIGLVRMAGFTGVGASGKTLEKALISFPDFVRGLKSQPSKSSAFRVEFASGGPVGSDTVPAWVTPGETILNPAVTRLFGSNFLNAVNQMKVAPSMLASVLSNFRPPAPRYFASGGIVPGASVPEQGTLPGFALTSGNVTININTPFAADDDRTVRRLMSKINDIQRRTGAP